MYLCYVDESGTGLKDPRGNFFTLAALTVRAQDWQRLDEAMIEYKRWISWAEPEDFELKARDIRHGHGVFRGLEENRRSELLIRMGELIGKLPVTVMAVTVNKRDLPPTIETEEQLYRGAFWRLLDTINELLREVSVPGILIVDSRSDLHTSVQDRRLVDAYRRYVALRKEGSMLVEVPLFGNSEFYSGIQLADFAAHYVGFSTAIRSFDSTLSFDSALSPDAGGGCLSSNGKPNSQIGHFALKGRARCIL